MALLSELYPFIDKVYELNISYTYKKKEFTRVIKYKEATIVQLIEFCYESEKKHFSIYKWICDFIEAQDEQEKKFVKYNLKKLYEQISATYFIGYLSWEKSNKKKKEKNKDPLLSTFIYIAKYLKVDLRYFLHHYTLTQVFGSGGIMDNITFLNNMQTKEWRKQNMISSAFKDSDLKRDLEIIENMKD